MRQKTKLGYLIITTSSSLALLVFAATGVSCSSSRNDSGILSSSKTTSNGTIVSDEATGRSRGSMQLTQKAMSSTYAYAESSPVNVGGGFGEGSNRTYQYLNSLRGAHGEPISYSRVGTCCAFKTPNSPFGGEGLLEVYEITSPGLTAPKRLYFNWYEDGQVFIPLGLTAVN